MSIFYMNAQKTVDGQEFLYKYDLSKFIDGTSDVPEETKLRVRTAVDMSGYTTTSEGMI